MRQSINPDASCQVDISQYHFSENMITLLRSEIEEGEIIFVEDQYISCKYKDIEKITKKLEPHIQNINFDLALSDNEDDEDTPSSINSPQTPAESIPLAATSARPIERPTALNLIVTLTDMQHTIAQQQSLIDYLFSQLIIVNRKVTDLQEQISSLQDTQSLPPTQSTSHSPRLFSLYSPAKTTESTGTSFSPAPSH